MRLLLIDDETLARVFVEQSLPPGAVLDYAQTLADGIDALQKTEYDLILCDLRMDGTPNGEALTCVLDIAPSQAVMVITALRFPGYAASLIRQGAVWVYFKPHAAIDTEIASDYLRDCMIFAVANHEAKHKQLLSLSQNVAAIEELRREVRELRSLREHVAVVEARRGLDEKRIEGLTREIDSLQAALSARQAEREKGVWSLWVKVLTMAGAAVAATVGPWLAAVYGRWGKP